MKKCLLMLSVLVLVAGCHERTEQSGKKFYVQLVRGNNEDVPPAPGARAVGPRVTERLQGVLRWKHYWELRRDSLVVSCGHKVRKQISPDREVEIEMSSATNMAVRIFLDGKLSQCRRQPVDRAFFITGGDRGSDHESWFIVVRDDEPSNYAVN